jgi:AcrR family transcriptional regulator
MPASTTEKRLRPRKTPRQERALETRARILDAARTVFAHHGYAGGTTNRIAAEALISVGSLYQYFPNKDAILVELVAEHAAEGRAALAPILERAAGDGGHDIPIHELVAEVVSTMVALHARDRRLHRVLFEESPRPASVLAMLRDLEDEVVAATVVLLDRPDVRVPDRELAARLSVTTIESLVHRLVASDHPIEIPALEVELTRLVVGYLTGGTARPQVAVGTAVVTRRGPRSPAPR